MEAFRIRDHLATGTFGTIYRGRHVATNRGVIIKEEKSRGFLQKEYKMYVYLWKYLERRHLLYIPRIYGFFETAERSYMVMEELTCSLDHMYANSECHFSLPTMLWVTVRGLQQLSELHRLGIVHRDIKPDNLGIKHGRLYLLDFGLSRQFVQPSGDHIVERGGYPLIGTLRYASLQNHRGKEQSRRDDLECFWYMLLFLFHNGLPWSSLDEEEKVRAKKEQLDIDRVCHDLPPLYSVFYKRIRDLGYVDRPQYEEFITGFTDHSRRFVDNGILGIGRGSQSARSSSEKGAPERDR